jgi:dTDP-4-amino-4,6-dideoxygalactose transaminase
MAAILATAGTATTNRPYALIPAFTFAATAAAVERCGYCAYLADVNADTWMLDPEQLLRHRLLDRIGLVVPVAPFGRPVPQAPWHAFQTNTGVPVVIDAAACFDTISASPAQFLGHVPAVLSFHATKSFGTGEGGCVISTDESRVERVAQALNFGFYATRDSASASLNGKMSEYHAAVGLAELDGWAAKWTSLQEVIECYRLELPSKNILSRFFAWPDISGCYALFFCLGSTEADRVQSEFRRGHIDFRFWYGTGLHRQSYFSSRLRDSVEVTEDIGQRLIGMPIAPDLTRQAVKRVTVALEKAVRGTCRPK